MPLDNVPQLQLECSRVPRHCSTCPCRRNWRTTLAAPERAWCPGGFGSLCGWHGASGEVRGLRCPGVRGGWARWQPADTELGNRVTIFPGTAFPSRTICYLREQWWRGLKSELNTHCFPSDRTQLKPGQLFCLHSCRLYFSMMFIILGAELFKPCPPPQLPF